MYCINFPQIKKNSEDILRRKLRKWKGIAKILKNKKIDEGVRKLENFFHFGIANKNYSIICYQR